MAQVIRITCFDPLRALLAWAIVLFHILFIAGYTVGKSGQYVVDAFVVLSGFVITLLLGQRKESYSLFIARRFLRLFPVYLVCLGGALAVRFLLPLSDSAQIFGGTFESENAFWATHLVAHLSMLQGLVPEIWLPHSSIAFLPPAWSISLEWQFYLVSPLVAWLIARHRPWAIGLFILSLAVLWPPLDRRGYSLFSEMGAFLPQRFYFFLAGALLARYARFLAGIKMPAWTRPLSWLGEISYPTYLVHYPILIALAFYLPPGGSLSIRAATLGGLSVPLIVLLSWALHLGVEKPWIAYGKRLGLKKLATSHPYLEAVER